LTRAGEVTRKRAAGTTEAERRWGNRKTSEADHLLSGLLACGKCGANLVLTAGKKGGYYGCFGAHRKGTCDNKRHVQRRKLETAIVGAVASLLDSEETATEVANRCNAKLRKRLAEDPNSVERLRAERDKLEKQVERLVSFVADGDSSAAVRTRLKEAEARLTAVSGQILRLEAVRRDAVLFTPHAVREKLRELVDVLGAEPGRARGVLQGMFKGPVRVVVEGAVVRVEGAIRVSQDGAEVTRAFEADVV
jgi:site-specific DNA recombinase